MSTIVLWTKRWGQILLLPPPKPASRQIQPLQARSTHHRPSSCSCEIARHHHLHPNNSPHSGNDALPPHCPPPTHKQQVFLRPTTTTTCTRTAQQHTAAMTHWVSYPTQPTTQTTISALVWTKNHQPLDSSQHGLCDPQQGSCGPPAAQTTDHHTQIVQSSLFQ